ncbi:MAG TPA: hypothetical protein VMI31_16830 [Fimbriimonadaceae bacterium]|nr:hypothetical protein [Fimbriimonadaceae bacterium]
MKKLTAIVTFIMFAGAAWCCCYMCVWNQVTSDPTDCTSGCLDGQTCYTITYDQAGCSFNVYGNCTLTPAWVPGAVQHTYPCTLAGSGCFCDTSYPPINTKVWVWTNLCSAQ